MIWKVACFIPRGSLDLFPLDFSRGELSDRLLGVELLELLELSSDD